MDYIEELRGILNRGVLNELNVGGKDIPGDDDGEDFVDEPSGDDTQNEPAPAAEEPTAQTDDTADDEGGEDFMDDDNSSTDDTQTDDTTSTDDTSSDDEGGEDFMDDGEEGGDSTTESEGEEGSDDEGGEDFMDDGSEGSDGEEGGDDSTTDGEEGNESSDSDSEYDISKIEDELFSELTPEQIAIKNYELKNNFVELYSIIGSTLVRINDISKTNDNINILKFITEKLLELREMIDYNITTAYQTRTYIENNIIYQQCIATLNTIAEIIEQIPGVDGKDIVKHDEEKKEEDKGYPVKPDENGNDQLSISDSSTIEQENYDYSSEYNDLF